MIVSARAVLILNAIVEGLAACALRFAPTLLTHPHLFGGEPAESAHTRAFGNFLLDTFGVSSDPAANHWAGGSGITAFARGILPCALLCLVLLSVLEAQATAPSNNVLQVFCFYHIGACFCMLTFAGLQTDFLAVAGWGVHAPLAAGFGYHAFVAPAGAKPKQRTRKVK